jgi:hypothetical protein
MNNNLQERKVLQDLGRTHLVMLFGDFLEEKPQKSNIHHNKNRHMMICIKNLKISSLWEIKKKHKVLIKAVVVKVKDQQSLVVQQVVELLKERILM